MRKLLLLPLIGLSILTGCHSAEYKKKSEWKRAYEAEQIRIQKEVSQLREREASAKARFLERYGRYQCSQDEIPKMEESKAPGPRFKSMQLGDHVTLKLRLGKAVHTDGSLSGPIRTESRYQLYWDHKWVAEAESLFSAGSEGSYENRIFYNPESHTLVVYDELNGDISRFITFEMSATAGKAATWTVKYFGVPDRPSPEPFPDLAKILGVGNGRIYVEYDGQPYAFPFDDFRVSKLEFTVG